MPLVKTTRFITIEQHIFEGEHNHLEATGELTVILHDLAFAIEKIAHQARNAGLNDILGWTSNQNVHGEKVRKIDEFANDTIRESMEISGKVCAMASEEYTDIVEISNKRGKGNYVLLYDPIDGSSNVDVNITTGTIFSLYRRLNTEFSPSSAVKDLLQPGWKQAAAGYALYGSSTMLVYTTGNGVNAFTFDPIIGKFLLIYENISIPEYGSHYSCNEGNNKSWGKELMEYLDYIKTPSEDRKRPFTQRYVAAVVADVHRILHYGGIYLYPGSLKKPNGKLRLGYEANPMSMIIEQAGGIATTGKQRILDIQPTEIHQTVPFIAGSRGNVEELMLFLNREHPSQQGR